MKSIDKFRNIPVKRDQNSSLEPLNKRTEFTPEQRMNIVLSAIEQTSKCIVSVNSYLKERERTKQIEAECRVRIAESSYRVEEVREVEMTKRFAIYMQTLLELKKIENEQEKINTLKTVISQVINTMNELKSLYNKTEDLKLVEMIHEENLKLIDSVRNLNALQ